MISLLHCPRRIVMQLEDTSRCAGVEENLVSIDIELTDTDLKNIADAMDTIKVISNRY